jgi:endonuclease III
MVRTSYENFKYNVDVHVFRITDSCGFRPIVHAQNNDVTNDLPARGGIETANDDVSRVSMR